MSDALPPALADLPPDPDGPLPHDGWAAVEVDGGGTVYGRLTEYELASFEFVRVDYQMQDRTWRTLAVPGHRVKEVLFMPEADVRRAAKKVWRDARRQDAKSEFESD